MRSYSEALKADKQLGSYISQRKKLQEQGFDKTSDAYKTIQNKINAAYGVSKRYELSDAGKKAQAAVSGGSKTLSTPKPGTTNVNRSTGGGTTGSTIMNRANAKPASPDPKMDKEFLRIGGKDIEIKTTKLGNSGATIQSAKIPTNYNVQKQGGDDPSGNIGKPQKGYQDIANMLKAGGVRLSATPNAIKMEKPTTNNTADNDAALMRGLGSRKEVRQAVKSGFIGKDQKKSAMSYAKANKQLAKQERKSTSAADKSQSFGTKTKTKTIKVGAETDITGNIIPGGRAAGTYERTKTVSIDPTTGKKVRKREYKRIT